MRRTLKAPLEVERVALYSSTTSSTVTTFLDSPSPSSRRWRVEIQRRTGDTARSKAVAPERTEVDLAHTLR